MNLSLRILQVMVAIVAMATVGCHVVQPASAQQSRPLDCTNPQLDEIVRKISKIRSETRGGASKPERCAAFVETVKKQPELERVLGLARDEPGDLLGEIIKILAQRAGCPGPQLNGLSWLQEFTEDCQDMIEWAAEAEKETAGEACDGSGPCDGPANSMDGTNKCQELMGDHQMMGIIRGLHEQVDKLLRELRAKKGCAATPGTLYEVDIVRGRDGKLGLSLDAMFGSAFVKRINAGSPAALAGLRFGDQVITINGRPAADKTVRESALVKTASSLRLLVKKSPFEQSFLLRRSNGDQELWGFKSESGVVVSVSPDSSASRAGLMERLKIITIDGESVLGFTNQQYDKRLSKRTLEMSLKLVPLSLYEKLVANINVDEQRKENNKMLLMANGGGGGGGS